MAGAATSGSRGDRRGCALGGPAGEQQRERDRTADGEDGCARAWSVRMPAGALEANSGEAEDAAGVGGGLLGQGGEGLAAGGGDGRGDVGQEGGLVAGRSANEGGLVGAVGLDQEPVRRDSPGRLERARRARGRVTEPAKEM
jgi:hypothetical protein